MLTNRLSRCRGRLVLIAFTSNCCLLNPAHYNMTIYDPPQWLSYEECTHYYNIPAWQMDKDEEVYCTTQVDALDAREFRRVRKAVLKILGEQAAALGVDAHDLEYWCQDLPVDRTMQTEVPEEIINEALFVRLQKEVLNKHPAWRCMFRFPFLSKVALVYPKCVRLSGVAWDEDWRQPLKEYAAEEIDERRRIKRPEALQHAWVKERLAKEGYQQGEKGWRVIGVFDNYGGDDQLLTVWLLTSGDASKAHSLEASDDPMAIGVSSDLWFDFDGTSRDHDTHAQWMARWPDVKAQPNLVPKRYLEKKLKVMESRCDIPGHAYDVAVDEIVVRPEDVIHLE